MPLTWDRPLQHLVLRTSTGIPAPLVQCASAGTSGRCRAGAESGPFAWKSVSGWAEGFFAAAMKRAGQVLELRLAVERVFDDEPDALIAVCGDFNAADHDTALRLACAGEDDTGSGQLARRVLTPVERSLAGRQRGFRVPYHRRRTAGHELERAPCRARDWSRERRRRRPASDSELLPRPFQERLTIKEGEQMPLGVW